MVLIDPSTRGKDGAERGFKVNCFAKSSAGLPQGKCGDVLLLQNIRVSMLRQLHMLVSLTSPHAP